MTDDGQQQRPLTPACVGPWLSLHHHHHVVSPSEHLVNDEATSWKRRGAGLRGLGAIGTAIVLVADLRAAGAGGYLVANVSY